METNEVLLLLLCRRLRQKEIVYSRSVVCKIGVRLSLAPGFEILIGDLLLFHLTLGVICTMNRL